MKIKSMQVKIEQVLTLLRLVESYADVEKNWRLIKESTRWSNRTFYHVAPACQYLHLIEKAPPKWIRLTYYGEKLVSGSEEGKEKEVLGKILLKWDESEYRIIKAFLSLYSKLDLYPSEPLELSDLHSELETFKVEVHISVLRDFIDNFYSFCQLVSVFSGKVSLNVRRLEQLESLKLFPTAEEISADAFFSHLYESYLLLLPRMGGIRSVPIPELRKLVCKRSALNVPPDVFDQKLITLPSEFRGKRISLTPPMERKAGGVFLGKAYYYYIAIYE
jgi:hypothetical protein